MTEPIQVPSAGEPEWQGEITEGKLDQVIGGLLVPNQAFSKAMARKLRERDERIAALEMHRINATLAEKKDCERALVALAGAGICTPEETYGTNSSWAIADLCRAVAALRKQVERLSAPVTDAELTPHLLGKKWPITEAFNTLIAARKGQRELLY